ncbi:MAG: M20 family metallopeptidase [Planctomycetota bacterium]|nr:M20 family metallopeptidase [Planctomycetota bacterium]MDA1213864.1 M20 family metallopeptidase [Planctomycetota bacterium]
MPIHDNLKSLHPELTVWRRELHAHPQTAFEETFASDFIASRLEAAGVKIHRGLATTGVVGTIEGSKPAKGDIKAIGLRADIDALDINEANDFAHKSKFAGKMHACGHDGHTTMLLGAACHLAKTKEFAGTVHFIFQPAEENEGGGRVMVEEGLFDKFPVDAVFGMHNWPGMPVGTFAVAEGPMMAAFDVFEVIVTGKGTHAAMPHLGIDPIAITSQIVTNLQSIASRQTNPLDQIVVSITQFHAGDTWNVIPNTAMLRGTVRSFSTKVQDMAESSIGRIVENVAKAHGASATLRYERRYPATINTAAESEWSAKAAGLVVGDEKIIRDPQPCMGSEDFAFMLQKKPGCYVWVGNGSADNDRVLHNPKYDFNDEIIPIGSSYWVSLVESVLGG